MVLLGRSAIDGVRGARALWSVLALVAGLLGGALIADSAQARVGASFSNRILEVRGSEGPERISVECSAGSEVVINGEVRRLLSGAPLPCTRVVEVDILARGGSDQIDLTGVDGQFGDANFRDFGIGTLAAVLAGRGDDRVRCGEAFCFVPDAGPGNDLVSGSPRRDLIYGGLGNDRLNGLEGRDQVVGQEGKDRLLGGGAADLLSGNQGPDVALGEDGDDLVGGGPGNDRLGGGLGDDRLIGGPGRDLLNGGPGSNQLFQSFP